MLLVQGVRVYKKVCSDCAIKSLSWPSAAHCCGGFHLKARPAASAGVKSIEGIFFRSRSQRPECDVQRRAVAQEGPAGSIK
jgi:hypothetical protein